MGEIPSLTGKSEHPHPGSQSTFTEVMGMSCSWEEAMSQLSPVSIPDD